MRIGIDYRLAKRHLGGMAVYLKNLVRQLKNIDHANEYILFDDNPSSSSGFEKHVWTIIWEHIWIQLCVPYLFLKKKIDVAYFPNPPISFFSTIPIILTIPDVSFIYDSSLPKWIKWYLWIMYFSSASRAHIITTFSQNSKNDIVRFFKVKSDKIIITPLAAADELVPQKSKGDRKKSYIITVPGTLIARKNVEETILAYRKLPINLINTFQLYVVGNAQGEDFERLKKLTARESLSEKIVFTGTITDKELSKLFSDATLYVCTSLYEGFGLSTLAAMKCGVPVISYSNSSLPEVAGNAGILVKNQSELTTAMLNVLKDEGLRNVLKEKGLKRASAFSWKKTASIFLANLNAI